LLIFLTGWFWLGVLADFGVFAASRAAFTNWTSPSWRPWDWMEHVPVIFRVLLFLMIGAALAIVAYHILRRFVREFRDRTLALLLERRFPKLLGDRLITAVELADVSAHTKVGYSRAMIEKTIQDAADRVDQIPLKQVFNWGRLIFLYGAVIFMAFGMFALFAIGFMICNSPTEKHGRVANGWREFSNVRAQWFSRNLGLHEVYYDRGAMLEVLGYPKYRLTSESMTTLKEKKHVPDEVLDKLDALVERFELTQASLDKLSQEDGMPPETLAKLQALKDGEVRPKDDFDEQLKKRLSSADFAKYRRNIANRARTTDKTTDEFLDAIEAQLTEKEYKKYSVDVLHSAKKLELRVGRDRGTAEVRVRAYKWVIATDDPLRGRYGWRPMKWSDVTEKLLSAKTEIPDLPESWLKDQPPAKDWLVDRVDYRLSDEDLDVTRLVQIRDALKKLDGEDKVLIPGEKISLRTKGHFIQDDDGTVRDLTWADLQDEDRAAKLGMVVPPLPKSWAQDMPYDDVVRRMKTIDLDRLLEIKSVVLDRLEDMADVTGFGRKVRALKLPASSDDIVIFYSGKDTNKSNKETLARQPNNEFVATLTELKEDITYTIRTEDYFTPSARIDIIPEPGLEEFTCERWVPAYICYRPTNGNPETLRGRFQMFGELGLSRTSEESTIEIPNGSKIVLIGRANTELKGPPTLTPYGADHFPVPATVSLDSEHPESFRIETNPLLIRTYDLEGKTGLIQKEYSFDVEIADMDNVRNQFHVKIKLKEDEKPAVNVKPVDYLREVKKGEEFKEYEGARIVTVDALLQFIGNVKDDHAIASVEFGLTVTPLGSSQAPLVSGCYATAVFGQFLDLSGAPMRGLTMTPTMRSLVEESQKNLGAGTVERTEPLRGFQPSLPRLQVDVRKLNEYLNRPFDEVYREIKGVDVPNVLADKDEFKLPEENPEVAATQTGLDLKSLRDRMVDASKKPVLRKATSSEPQTRYKIQVEVEAKDADVESGPHKAQNKESFTFLVVADSDLLILISRDEEELGSVDIVKAMDDLGEAEVRTKDGWRDVKVGPKNIEDFPRIAIRVDKANEGIERARTGAQKVRDQLKQLLLEVQANRMESQVVAHQDMVTQANKIADKDFEELKAAMKVWHEILDKGDSDLDKRTLTSQAAAEDVRVKMTQVIEDLRALRGATGKMLEFATLIKNLNDAADLQAEVNRRLEDLYRAIIDDLLNPKKGSGSAP